MNGLERGCAFPASERARVFLKAAFCGKDPLLEVALVGLARPGLDDALQLHYAKRVLGKGEIRRFFECARANHGMCTEANGLGVEAVERRGERIIEFEMARPVFVFD